MQPMACRLAIAALLLACLASQVMAQGSPPPVRLVEIGSYDKTNQQGSPKVCSYTVKAGDTFYSISQEFDTDVTTIQVLNPGVDPLKLAVGQKLNVPCKECKHTVVAGDTVRRVGRAYHSPKKQLLKLNPGLPADLAPLVGKDVVVPCPCDHTVSLGDTWKSLAKQFKAPSGKWIKYLNPGSMKKPAVGEVVKVPCLKKCTWTIKGGDTFWVIAQQLGVEVSEIQQLNPGIEPTELEIGQVINIPCK